MKGALLFGPFRLDLAGRQLWCGEQLIVLTPKALDLLLYLAQHAGQLLTRDELFEALWPGTHVDDHALSVQIRDIRKALGDDVRNPQYVETRHRRGYCFKAPVTRAEATPDTKVSRTETAAQAALTIPETHYTRSGDVNIAYQVTGNGPIDLVFVMGWVSHVEYFWTEPRFARFLRRLASFSRLILFDKRGTGLSDRVPLDQLPTIEQRMDDLRAVLDAVGSTRAAICGVSEGGCMSAVFAATHPEQTESLIMIGSYAKRLWAPDYTWAPTWAERQTFLDEIRDRWGGPVGIEERAPSLASDPQFRQWWATYLRMGASPGAAIALTQMNTEIDIRDVLPLVGVPTLVIHRTGDRCLKVEEGRYVASRIPRSRFVELPGSDHLPFVGDQESVLEEVERFVAQVHSSSDPDRVLATLLIASFEEEILGSRSRLLEECIRTQMDMFSASGSQDSQDGVLAMFDGPARAVRCACTLEQEASRLGFRARIGLHTGECISANGFIRGTAVDIARRIQQVAAPGEVLVSGTLRDLVAGSGITFHPRGRLEIDTGREWQLLKVHES
jgi:pimeloyl-ACP methyl ester carboxylesterase/DNA-binding winged helix-turn-helix (wHTH) protein